MTIVYGSKLCPDCVQAEQAFKEKGIAYEYRDITENLAFLKEFLAIRDANPQFDGARAHKGIGIPCIMQEGKAPELDVERFLEISLPKKTACSIDGKGC